MIVGLIEVDCDWRGSEFGALSEHDVLDGRADAERAEARMNEVGTEEGGVAMAVDAGERTERLLAHARTCSLVGLGDRAPFTGLHAVEENAFHRELVPALLLPCLVDTVHHNVRSEPLHRDRVVSGGEVGVELGERTLRCEQERVAIGEADLCGDPFRPSVGSANVYLRHPDEPNGLVEVGREEVTGRLSLIRADADVLPHGDGRGTLTFPDRARHGDAHALVALDFDHETLLREVGDDLCEFGALTLSHEPTRLVHDHPATVVADAALVELGYVERSRPTGLDEMNEQTANNAHGLASLCACSRTLPHESTK